MYQKYHTDALVLSSRELGEADKNYALYTRDFGLVRARASAVRREKSRMRYALQNYSQANVSLVRGKRGWRVAGARPCQGVALTTGPRAVSAFARISELVLRLVQGEEKNEYLFAALSDAHRALFKENSQGALVPTIEIVCVARVLFALGYISAEALETALFSHTDYSIEHLREAVTHKDKLLASINKAISETHL